jgi:Zn-dependent protease
MRAISPQALLAWVVFGYLLLLAVRYTMGARIYLTCALRQSRARAVPREQVDPGELQLLTLCDDELVAAGFRPLGFLHVTPLLTYYGAPLPHSAFVNERLPAYAIVRRALAPEYARPVEIEIRTETGAGEHVVTLNTPYARTFAPRDMLVEGYPGASVAALVDHHRARLTTGSPVANANVANAHVANAPGIESLLRGIEADVGELHAYYRAQKWVVPTADPNLERFTLRGAFALTHYSRRIFSARPVQQGRRAANHQPILVPPAPALSFEEQRALRVEAELHDVLAVAEYPQAPPGTPWPLLTVIAATALVSFAAMAWLWDVTFAALILVAVTLHEAGHAVSMRMLGYRDVHVFFVPLLGAMTVGRPVATSVRNRLVVLLAGPIPGLWLGVLLVAIDQVYGPQWLLRFAALALLLLNGLNLLPFTPLDGGKALETLTRPESLWRLVVHGVSAAGLLGLAAYTKDPLISALGVFWVALLPRQLKSYRLCRAVAAGVQNRGDFRAVVRATLEVLTTPPYQSLRAATRQATARVLGRAFAESIATPGDRAWGAVAYAAAWIPVIVAVWRWAWDDHH